MKLPCLLRGFVLTTLFGTTIWAQSPQAPSELATQASRPGDLAISLFWVDNSTDETGFEIQRSIENGAFETIAVGALSNVSTYNDIGLLENTSYTYRVNAYNANGKSPYSNVASAKTSYAMPNQVGNLAANVQNGSVVLTWTDESDNETLFAVERAELGVSTAFELIAEIPANSITFTDSSAVDGATYTYRITPWRFNVAGGAPLTVDVQTGPAIASLASVSARAKSRSSIELSWRSRLTRNANVQIQRFDSNTGFWVDVATVRASARSYVESRLQSRTAYSYRLRLVTGAAVSAWSETSATTR